MHGDPTEEPTSAAFTLTAAVAVAALTHRMHKVIDPTHRPLPNGKPPFPVLILHGLFQSSGSFVTSEERSLAFWLARQGGYSVYLGNTRGGFDMGHRSYSRGDPRFWGESGGVCGMNKMEVHGHKEDIRTSRRR
jgi:pimeloyl-ACP methyl ester carboxylesterase